MAKGKRWMPEEMELRGKLGHMLEQLNRPTEYLAKLSELESLQHMQAGQHAPKHTVSPTDLDQLFHCLDGQRYVSAVSLICFCFCLCLCVYVFGAPSEPPSPTFRSTGLENLLEIMRKDRRDLDIIRDSLSERNASGEWVPPVDSDSSLRLAGRDAATALGAGAGAGSLRALPGMVGGTGAQGVPKLSSTAFLSPR